eukprot:scaffold17193_cov69-Phaeocystis_antarctica.AAC.3
MAISALSPHGTRPPRELRLQLAPWRRAQLVWPPREEPGKVNPRQVNHAAVDRGREHGRRQHALLHALRPERGAARPAGARLGPGATVTLVRSRARARVRVGVRVGVRLRVG